MSRQNAESSEAQSKMQAFAPAQQSPSQQAPDLQGGYDRAPMDAGSSDLSDNYLWSQSSYGNAAISRKVLGDGTASEKETSLLSDISLNSENALAVQRKIGNQAAAVFIQTKLKIGQPGDVYEQEADRMADRVMRTTEPPSFGEETDSTSLSSQHNCGQCGKQVRAQSTRAPGNSNAFNFTQSNNYPDIQPCPTCARKLQQKSLDSHSTNAMPESGVTAESRAQSKVSEAAPKIESYLSASQGSGQPLSESARSFAESRFGQDFSQVRVHTDLPAASASNALNAEAFTTEQDVYFGPGRYQPDTSEGRRLIAHELTHVVQQTGGASQQSVQAKPRIAAGEFNIQRQPASQQTNVPTTATPAEAPAPKLPPDFDPKTQAEKLHEAFSGWGTDERTVFDVLWTGRRDMTQAIEAAYNGLYSPPLEERLHEELSGEELQRALILLGHGKLDLRDKIREVVQAVFQSSGLNAEKLFHTLDEASPDEISALNSDSVLQDQVRSILSDEQRELFNAYLKGKGVLAAKLRMAISGWGTDEEAIWKGIESASPEERQELLSDEFKALRDDVKDDLSEEDQIRFDRSLQGALGNLDRIEMAAAGWGTDEGGLKAALSAMTAEEFNQLSSSKTIQGLEGLDSLLESELSGGDLEEAREIVNQKRLAFDANFREQYLKEQGEKLGEGALEDEGAAVLLPDKEKGETMSVIGKLKVAAAGMGTDEKAIWNVLNSLTEAQRRFIRERNPEGVLDVLSSDLSESDYERAMELLSGGAASVKAGIRQAIQEAIDGWGTDRRMLYDSIDRGLREGVAQEILADPELDQLVKIYIGGDQYQLFRTVLETGSFTPMMRLQWATTAMEGTDEDLVFELCQQYGKQWYTGSPTDPSVDKTGAVAPEVDAILKSELDTRDYWKALDLMRGEPETEQERLARAKESLERERGEGISNAIMDAFSFSGENADDAWREYRATYNRALEDGKISPEEQEQLRKDERYSKEMTTEYREAKSKVAQWAASIAVAIVGIAATILTAGAAGPFVLALGGKVLFVAEAMVLAAALKVGINRAVQGEGYDVTSTQALVDAVSASVEVGLSVVGGHLASRFMQGVGKTVLAQSVGPAVQRAFGQAGTRILVAGLEGSIDATIGGIGEGVVQGLANEKTWASGVEGFFTNMGESVGVNALMSGVGGFVGGAAFKSIGDAVGPRLKGKVLDESIIKVDEPTVKTEKPSDLDLEAKSRAINSDRLAEQPAIGGHGIGINKEGQLSRCSGFCEVLRTRYAEVLDRNPALDQALKNIENLALQAKQLGDAKLAKKAVEQAAELEGRIFEQSAKDVFAKKIVNQNERIFDSSGRVTTEIDFETDEALVEVGLSLGGKMDQLHQLAEIAASRKKRLDILYGPDTPPTRLRAMEQSLKKKWGTRVRFIPHDAL